LNYVPSQEKVTRRHSTARTFPPLVFNIVPFAPNSLQ